jgi:hypothetical protein
MFDSALVTVCTKNGEFTMDFDIPAQEPIGELKGKLFEILRAVNQPLFGGWADIHLVDAKTATMLMAAQTLEEAGIWDGSVLYVMKGGANHVE